MIIETDIKNTYGTCFNDGYITTSVNELVSILGIEPHTDGDYKTNYNWYLEYQYENGNTIVFTIYDYKYYREIPRDEVIEFHIGNKCANEITEIVDILKSYNINAYYVPYKIRLEQRFPGIINEIEKAINESK